jgi:hypothetical protein
MSDKKFDVGDIVKYDGNDEAYYIITDMMDFTEESDEQPDIDYELMSIFPIKPASDIEMVRHAECVLKRVAVYGGKKYYDIMESVEQQRVEMGHEGAPEYLVRLFDNLPLKAKNNGKSLQSKPKFKKVTTTVYDEKEIKRILADEEPSKKMNAFAEKMDLHLDLLHKAMEEGNSVEVDFQKDQLEKVRQTLMELEYFTLNKRRSGTSIRIK